MPEEPIRLFTTDPSERASWEGLRDLAEVLPLGWSLARGTLVRLHTTERNAASTRSTTDIDLILDIRAHPRTKHNVGHALSGCGFRIAQPPNPAGHDHRWERPVAGERDIKAQIDVLAPSGLRPSTYEKKFPGIGRLLATRGAQFGIDRSELVTVTVDDELTLTVNRPDAIGALYEKCSALLNHSDTKKRRHYEDINQLCAVLDFEDRQALGDLRQKELKRLSWGIEQTIIALGTQTDERTQRVERLIRRRN
ncbi:hypothetical protein [Corynebacterium glaucum]|uniref:hypothetical protein n=1 Tax=Corynebacterium glaucum TaxID=187491 RepID=UPI002659F0D6|nr:hypothetical protein [Corynebacterium glaucum]